MSASLVGGRFGCAAESARAWGKAFFRLLLNLPAFGGKQRQVFQSRVCPYKCSTGKLS